MQWMLEDNVKDYVKEARLSHSSKRQGLQCRIAMWDYMREAL